MFQISIWPQGLKSTEDEVSYVLTECLSAYIELAYRAKRKTIPLPSTRAADNSLTLYVPIKLQLRIHLWNTMLEQRYRQSDLAKLLNVSNAMINQMVNGKGNISAERYEEVLQLLGKYLMWVFNGFDAAIFFLLQYKALFLNVFNINQEKSPHCGGDFIRLFFLVSENIIKDWREQLIFNSCYFLTKHVGVVIMKIL